MSRKKKYKSDEKAKPVSAIAKAATPESSYPPYNISETAPNTFKVEIAVAGFDKSELEVKLENAVLTVSGKSEAVAPDYMVKGIALRPFVRRWKLADTVVAKSAKLDDGILTVEIEKLIPESWAAHTIEIDSSECAHAPELLLETSSE
jgi:molecular chaperone IbpA